MNLYVVSVLINLSCYLDRNAVHFLLGTFTTVVIFRPVYCDALISVPAFNGCLDTATRKLKEMKDVR